MLPLGEHLLSGVESFSVVRDYDKSISGYYLVIDDTVYAFEIDPDDGYRSYGDLSIPDNIKKEDIRNSFQPVRVIISDEPESGKEAIMYAIRDCSNGKVILRIGTDYTDGYYPCAIFDYYPENMVINNRIFKDAEEYKEKSAKSEYFTTVSTLDQNIQYQYNYPET